MPQLLSYQGRLANAPGLPMNAVVPTHFALFNGGTMTATMLWGESQASLPAQLDILHLQTNTNTSNLATYTANSVNGGSGNLAGSSGSSVSGGAGNKAGSEGASVSGGYLRHRRLPLLQYQWGKLTAKPTIPVMMPGRVTANPLVN